MREGLALLRARIAAVQGSLETSGKVRYGKLSNAEKSLHHAALVTNEGDPHYRALDDLHFEADGVNRRMEVPRGDVLHQFRKDVNEGKLPAVSWLTAPEAFSDHPSSPWYGAWYLSEVMDILTANPEVWKKTILIVTYDENDGYFDHVPSYVAADPKRPETGAASAGIDCGLEYTYKEDELRMGVTPSDARTGPIGMGFRVPMIVASPWSRGGWVNSQVCDHTSTLMFLEQFVETKSGRQVREENISAWRRTVSGDLTSVFRPFDPGQPKLDFLNRDKFVIGIEKAREKEIPSNFTKLTPEQAKQINEAPRSSELMPQQERGVRPSCALPYELYSEGALSRDGSAFTLSLSAGDRVHRAQSAGAAFNVYLRNLHEAESSTRVATYAVKAGDTMNLRYPLTLFADERCVVEVHGPNGFYRSFSGLPESQRSIASSLQYEPGDDGLTGNIVLHLKNDGTQPASVTVTANAYGQLPLSKAVEAQQQTSVVLELASSHGWYDFTVKTDGVDAEVRYAGRVETGKSSISDPFMGRV